MVDLPPTMIMRIKTSDKAGAETNSSVIFAFYDINGKRSKDIEHVCGWMGGFKRGSIKELEADAFSTDFGLPDKIEIYLKSGDWFVEWIEVKDGFTKESYVFPIHRRIKSGKKLRFKLHDCLLPQDDDENTQRQEELVEKKAMYQFVWPYSEFPPESKGIPSDVDYTPDYKKAKVNRFAQMAYNISKIRIFTGKWKSFADIRKMYNDYFTAPKTIDHWREDRHFGAQRLNGGNFALLRLCKDIPNRFPVTNEMLQPIMDMTIEEAIADKRLYILDLELLKDLPATYKENENKICAPLGLFLVTKDGDLMPVAIQLKHAPGDDNPIFLPTDPAGTWLLAKMWFNTADITYSQISSHMHSHLLMESIAVATFRCLSTSHPIYRLMAPHLLNNIPGNRAWHSSTPKGGPIKVWKVLEFSTGLRIFRNEGAALDQISLCGSVGATEIVRRRWKNFRLDREGHLPNDLKNRGVDDPEALPNYYWREDMMLHWDAIYKYVTTIVNGNYVSDDKVANDTEIQEWARVLCSVEDGCRLKGVPEEGAFQARDQLIDTVTSLIYIPSAYHASVNFVQYEQNSFVPNNPAYLHDLPPTDKSEVSDEYLFKILPTKEQALTLIQGAKGTNMRTTKSIGDFDVEYQFDPIGTDAVRTFRKDLLAIATTIDARNEKRAYPYIYLHPQNVPNSISN